MPRIAREEILSRLRAKIARGQPIVGGGAGTGLSAKCEENGGIDLIVIYNSGRYRMAGRGSLSGLLAYGNANDVVMEMAREILPVVKHTPVLAGVNGTDPFCNFDRFLDALKLEDCPALADEWADAALSVNKDAIILVHGGPVSEPADAEFMLKNTRNCHGFYGASSMERLPTERALTEQTRKFKAVAFG